MVSNDVSWCRRIGDEILWVALHDLTDYKLQNMETNNERRLSDSKIHLYFFLFFTQHHAAKVLSLVPSRHETTPYRYSTDASTCA